MSDQLIVTCGGKSIYKSNTNEIVKKGVKVKSSVKSTPEVLYPIFKEACVCRQ